MVKAGSRPRSGFAPCLYTRFETPEPDRKYLQTNDNFRRRRCYSPGGWPIRLPKLPTGLSPQGNTWIFSGSPGGAFRPGRCHK